MFSQQLAVISKSSLIQYTKPCPHWRLYSATTVWTRLNNNDDYDDHYDDEDDHKDNAHERHHYSR